MRKLKFGFSVIVFFSSILFSSLAYSQGDISQVDIGQLSDQQLQQYLNQANMSGLSEADLEAKAVAKGLSSAQIQLLKSRVAGLNSSTVLVDTNGSRKSVVTVNNNPVVPTNSDELRVYGSELFSNSNLTFTPNLQIPTPKNYVLGTGDILNIDVFGYSDASYQLTVTPEGVIRIPNLGPVKVIGLSFDDAQQKIKSNLTKIYPQISSGNTSVNISLGQIRTIRVTLAGEITKPGTYSLPSLATIANALYVSGGPNDIGSYRSIDLVRNGKVVTKFDLYDFLLKGDLTKNLMLQDDDIIKVNPYNVRVSITGAIKRKAIYELDANETLSNLLKIAGGFTTTSYTEFIRLSRNAKDNKEAIIVPEKNYSSFQIRNGDAYSVDAIDDRYTNRITIDGAVYHSGTYSLQNFKNLKDLLQTAGLKEEAFLQRGIISRKDSNYLPQTINFNVTDVMNGTSDIVLQREDAVHIFNLLELRESYTISVNGEVNNPQGAIQYADGMKLQDAILLAGGFKEGASGKRIEISRRIRSTSEDEQSKYAVVQTIELDKNLEELKTNTYLLEPFDIISVRKNPSYIEQSSITVSGQVLYPGIYTIESNHERLSDIIKRAGGFKSAAYPKGAILNRKNDENANSTKTQELQAINLVNITDSSKKINSDSLINKLNAYSASLGIKLDEAVKNPGSKYDVFVQEGDVLNIPKQINAVKTWGAVYVPKQIVFEDDIRFKRYVNESGGFTPEAHRSKSFVIYANGSIARTRHFLFFRKYPIVEENAVVFVPSKPSKQPVNFSGVTAFAAILGSLATTFWIIKNL